MTNFLDMDDSKFLIGKKGPNSSDFLEEITQPTQIYDVIYNVFFHQSHRYIYHINLD